MKRYRISRIFIQRMTWTVKAKNEEQAKAMLDDEDQTPNEAADEEWLGAAEGFDQYEDEVIEIDKGEE